MPDQTFRLNQESIPRSIPGSGISWVAPGLRGEMSYDFKAAPRATEGQTRDSVRMSEDPLDQAVAEIGVLEAHDLEIEAPTPEVRDFKGVRGVTEGLGEDEVAVDYNPKPDEYSFVIYRDEDGSISIHFPQNLSGITSALAQGGTPGGTVRGAGEPVHRYRITLREANGSRGTVAGPSTTRFGVTTIGKKLIKLVVGKIVEKTLEPAVGAAVYGAVWAWENSARKFEGFHGGENTSKLFSQIPVPLREADWAFLEGTGKRTLLFVHGTTSTTDGGFGKLAAFPEVANSLYRKYQNRVIGFDHHTLTKSVGDNVTDFYRMLPANGQFTFDIVCHSRGGLVARALKELSPDEISTLTSKPCNRSANVTIGKIVFVGTPNTGTQLADPKDIPHALNLLANVASLFPGAGLALGGILSWAAYVAEAGFGALPGLQNMNPGNEFLTLLNQGSGDGKPSPLADYSVVESSFSVDGIVNQVLLAAVKYLFKGNLNDLIVPTLGVSEIDGVGLAPEVVYRFDGDVAHTRYFERPETWQRIESALA